tara:strand:- start:537 stop:1118 length:582 start_codon:yes stop_codon:yes gene_type:complete
MIANICAPAFIYLAYGLIQVIMDTFNGLYNTAIIKSITTIIFTLILNALCSRGLSVVSWLIVFIPFIMMTIITALMLMVFGLDPSTGKRLYGENTKKVPDARMDGENANLNMSFQSLNNPQNRALYSSNQNKAPNPPAEEPSEDLECGIDGRECGTSQSDYLSTIKNEGYTVPELALEEGQEADVNESFLLLN